MQTELIRKLPILKVAGEELAISEAAATEEGPITSSAAAMSEKQKLLEKATQLLRENTRLKEELAQWEEELAAQDQMEAQQSLLASQK